MAAQHRHRPFPGFYIFLFLLFIGRCVEAQSPSNQSTNSTSNNGPNLSFTFNPSMAIIVVLLVSAFFFLGFFSIYIRKCGGDRNDSFATTGITAVGLIRIQQGLDPDVLANFPTLVYSEVKEHKIGKGALECAICLNEFEDEETIRLLPECDHVFHQECIDAWLGTHVTCPVCRTNYTRCAPDRASRVPTRTDGVILEPVEPEAVLPPDALSRSHSTAITVDDMDVRKEEMRELARIASKVRGTGPRRSKWLSRSHSTGHSMLQQGEASLDRYTLRLPENLRREIIAAGKLQRSRTFAVTVTLGGPGEASMKKVSRGPGEGSSRRGRTIRLGRSDRWPSFFGRSLSSKISTFGNWRRGEEGYVKEKSMNRKLSGVKAAVDDRRGAGGGPRCNGDDNSDEASTAALNRV